MTLWKLLRDQYMHVLRPSLRSPPGVEGGARRGYRSSLPSRTDRHQSIQDNLTALPLPAPLRSEHPAPRVRAVRLAWLATGWFLLLLGGTPPALSQMPLVPDLRPDGLGEQLHAIDRMVGEARFEPALDELRRLSQEHPNEVEVLWRLSRVKIDVGFDFEPGSDGQQRLYRAGLEVAHAAESLDPAHPEAHLAIAMASGRLALVSGLRDRVEHSRAVLIHAERAVELDREHDVAYHVRARWHYEVATLGVIARAALRVVYGGMPDASLADAEADFRRAIEIEDRIIHRLELAKTLVVLDREEEACEHLERALDLPLHAPRDPLYQAEARQLLVELRGERGSGSSQSTAKQ